MDYPKEYYYTQPLRQLPAATRPATRADFDRPRKEILGMAYYVRSQHGQSATRYVITPFTQGLGPMIRQGMVFVDEPLQWEFPLEQMQRLARQFPARKRKNFSNQKQKI